MKAKLPLVLEPPLLLITTLQLALLPATKLVGADLLILKCGAVGLLTVHELQVPALVATVLIMLVTPSVSVPTVTVKVLVTLAPTPTLTSWV